MNEIAFFLISKTETFLIIWIMLHLCTECFKLNGKKEHPLVARCAQEIAPALNPLLKTKVCSWKVYAHSCFFTEIETRIQDSYGVAFRCQVEKQNNSKRRFFLF